MWDKRWTNLSHFYIDGLGRGKVRDRFATHTIAAKFYQIPHTGPLN